MRGGPSGAGAGDAYLCRERRTGGMSGRDPPWGRRAAGAGVGGDAGRWPAASERASRGWGWGWVWVWIVGRLGGALDSVV